MQFPVQRIMEAVDEFVESLPDNDPQQWTGSSRKLAITFFDRFIRWMAGKYLETWR